MRKVLYGAACSLDGFVAGEHDEVDWLNWSEDVAAIAREVWATTDAVLMGRRTYEVAVRNGIDAYPGVRNYVFSSTLARGTASARVTIVDEDAAAFVRRLREEPGRDICVLGGGRLAASLLDAGLIDEIGVNIQPFLLGRGVAMFPAGFARARLELVEGRELAGGCWYARYSVPPGPGSLSQL